MSLPPEPLIDDIEDDGGEQAPPARPWPPLRQDIAAVCWASFLAAAVGTALFFAFIDPIDLFHALGIDPGRSRLAGYGHGFFFFWLLCLSAAALTLFLVRTAHRRNGQGSDEH